MLEEVQLCMGPSCPPQLQERRVFRLRPAWPQRFVFSFSSLPIGFRSGCCVLGWLEGDLTSTRGRSLHCFVRRSRRATNCFGLSCGFVSPSGTGWRAHGREVDSLPRPRPFSGAFSFACTWPELVFSFDNLCLRHLDRVLK